MKITKDTFLSSTGLFVIYMVLSCLIIMGFRFLFPAEPPPLSIYSNSWRLIQGVLTYIGLFPALTMTGLVIPFGFRPDFNDEFGSFSLEFLDQVKSSIMIAITAVTIYGGLFFLAFPLAQNYETHLRSEGTLFKSSKEKAQISAEKRNWPEAAQFIIICEQIWTNSPEIETLRGDIIRGMEAWRIAQAEAKRGAWVEEDSYTDIVSTYSALAGQESPVNATEALFLADKALQAERYYDAHWLANLGVRLAKQGSLERVQGTRLASLAWNRVGSLEPTTREVETYTSYRKKRSGYEALVSEDWVRAYYIFKELSAENPGDPDVNRFLALSEKGIDKVAFFTDEMDLALGEIHTDTLFSFPSAISDKRNGRTVLRIGSLFASGDFSYALGIDLMTFDENGNLLYRVEAPYAKILPITLGSVPRIVLMMRALDRSDRQKIHEPIWSGPEQSFAQDPQLLLDITYDDFLLLSRLKRGLDPLLMGELLTIAKRIGVYGYIPQLFQAEILYRLSEVAISLPLSILIIVVGWRYRTNKRSLIIGIPMLVVLPLVFNGLVFFCRSVLNTLSIWLVISFGFSVAIVFFVAGMIVLFLFSLIILVAQHG